MLPWDRSLEDWARRNSFSGAQRLPREAARASTEPCVLRRAAGGRKACGGRRSPSEAPLTTHLAGAFFKFPLENSLKNGFSGSTGLPGGAWGAAGAAEVVAEVEVTVEVVEEAVEVVEEAVEGVEGSLLTTLS